MFQYTSSAFTLPGVAAPSGMLAEGASFQELNPTLKTQLSHIEAAIRAQENLRDEIVEHMKATRAKQKLNVNGLQQSVSALAVDIDRQLASMQAFKEQVRHELKEGESSLRQMEKIKDLSSRMNLQQTVVLPSKFDLQKEADFRERMSEVRSLIDDVDQYLTIAMQDDSKQDPAALQDTLKAVHDSLILTTAKVSQQHGKVDELRESLKTFLLKWTGQAKDPFAEADRLEKKAKTRKRVPHVQMAPQQQPAGPAQPSYTLFGNTGSPTTGFNFGYGTGQTQPTGGLGFGFGQPQATTGYGFGTIGQQQTQQPGFNFGFGTQAPTGTQPGGFGFGFGSPTAATGTTTGFPTTGFGFGQAAQPQGAYGFGFGGGQQPAAQAGPSFNFGQSAFATPQQPSGAGGTRPGSRGSRRG